MNLLIGAKQLQKYLSINKLYKGQIDGIFGPRSQRAAITFAKSKVGVKPWSNKRYIVATQQLLFKELGFATGEIDGLVGPSTLYAQEQFQDHMRGVHDDVPPPDPAVIWPTYNNMTKFYGNVGQNIKLFLLPYKMKLAWDTDTTVTKISLNKKCGDSAMRVYERVLDHYGLDGITKLRLDLFGGSLNVRKMRGGNNWSTHSWGAAIDTDPIRNQFRWSAPKAVFSRKNYDKWFELWEEEGWVSLGKERNYDWMHVQAVRL